MQTWDILTREVYDSVVQAILNKPGYRHLRLPWTNLLESVLEYIEKGIMELLGSLFDRPGTSTPFTGGVSVFVLIIGIAALAALIVLIASLLVGMFRKSQGVQEILGETITEETTPDALMEKSHNAERLGDTRQAVRYAFIAVLLKMHRARMVYLEDAWTNQELYRHLERSRFPSLRALKGIMEGFNASWYGHKGMDGSTYAQWHSDLEQVWQEVASREV